MCILKKYISRDLCISLYSEEFEVLHLFQEKATVPMTSVRLTQKDTSFTDDGRMLLDCAQKLSKKGLISELRSTVEPAVFARMTLKGREFLETFKLE